MTKSWASLIVGAWILISPWILGFAYISLMKWSNLAAGTIIILMSMWDIFGEKSPEGKSVEEKVK